MKRIGFFLIITLAVMLIADSVLLCQEKKEKVPEPEKTKEMMKKEMMKGEKAIKVKEMEPFNYCAIEMTGSYEQHQAAIDKLYQEAGKQGVSIEAAPFGLYLNDPESTPEKELKWEVGIPLDKEMNVEAPLVKKSWGYPLVATMHYNGPFDGEAMGPEYLKLFTWIAKNNYTPAGPMAEKYLGMPQKNEKGQLCGNVLIMVPVKKEAEGAGMPEKHKAPCKTDKEVKEE